MKKTRYTESQIIKVLNEVEGGRAVKDVRREYGISMQRTTTGSRSTMV